MSGRGEVPEHLFTDFDGKFKGRLARVRRVPANYTSEWSGTAARYECRIKVYYNKEVMSELEEGMMVAVPNFRSRSRASVRAGLKRYTVMVISNVWPEHYGIEGVSDSHYYPVQFEVIEQSVKDWESDDQSTMKIEMSAVPINYDLVVYPDNTMEFRKGFSYPLPGAEVHVLSLEAVDSIYNDRVRKSMGLEDRAGASTPDPRLDPRVGVLRLFEELGVEVPIYVDLYKLVRYHFGVFSFTGGGKSNLLSNLLRRILYHTEDTKVVVFDVSCEYPFLLSDVLADNTIPSTVVLEEQAIDAAMFAKSIVKPRDFEDDGRADLALKRVYERQRVTHFTTARARVPTYGDVLSDIHTLMAESVDRPTYLEALEEIRYGVHGWMDSESKTEGDLIDEGFVDTLAGIAEKAVAKFGVYQKSGVYTWATTRRYLKDKIRRAMGAKREGVTGKDILAMLRGDQRLIVISIADPETMRDLVVELTTAALWHRKRSFEIRPYILFVFDEAQEFIPSGYTGPTAECSRAVERLLRQGRKYGLGGAVATQRIAYLNTNALQQLHTFFVGTLPRPYDRSVVSSSFQIDISILDKTLEFPPGSWLLSSYIATGIDNVPIFVRADNSEDVLRAHLDSL